MPTEPVLTLMVTVYADRMDFRSCVDEATGFEVVRAAMTRARDELDRQLREGPAKCPFSPR